MGPKLFVVRNNGQMLPYFNFALNYLLTYLLTLVIAFIFIFMQGVSEYAGTLLLALCPLLALYFSLTSALKPRRDTSSSLSPVPQLSPPMPSPINDPTHQHVSVGAVTKEMSVTGAMQSSIDLPLLKGLHLFIADNLLMWLHVLVVQPSLGLQWLHWCIIMAIKVNLLTCSLIVLHAFLRPARIKLAAGSDLLCSKKEEACHGPEDSRGDLTELFIVLTMFLLLTLCWVGAQHYTLAMVLALPLVPLLCTVVACGTWLEVIDAEKKIPLTPLLPSPVAAGERTELAHNHIQEVKEEVTAKSQAHDDVTGSANKECSVVENPDIDACAGAPTSIPPLPLTDKAPEHTIRVSEQSPVHVSRSIRRFCRLFLLLLCCACTPSGACALVFCIKRLFLSSSQSHQTYMTSMSYTTALAADWINAEVLKTIRFFRSSCHHMYEIRIPLSSLHLICSTHTQPPYPVYVYMWHLPVRSLPWLILASCYCPTCSALHA